MPQAKIVKKRYFWPPYPGSEKLEYLNFFISADDVTGGAGNKFAEAVFGKLVPTAMFGRPHSIASDGHGRVFVGDVQLGVVFVLDLAKKEVRFLKNSRGQKNYAFGFSAGIAVGPGGQVFVVDSLARKVFQFGADERLINSFHPGGQGRLGGIVFSPSNNRLYLADIQNHRVLMFSAEGEEIGFFGVRGGSPGEFNYPLDVAVDAAGLIYVLDAMNARIQVFDTATHFLREFGERGTAPGSFQMAKSLAVSASGQVYVTDSLSNKIVVFDLVGNYLITVGGKFNSTQGTVSPGGLYMPEGIAVDSADQIWVCDSLNRAVHEFQYLNQDYLGKHPILPGQSFIPSMLKQENSP